MHREERLVSRTRNHYPSPNADRTRAQPSATLSSNLPNTPHACVCVSVCVCPYPSPHNHPHSHPKPRGAGKRGTIRGVMAPVTVKLVSDLRLIA